MDVQGCSFKLAHNTTEISNHIVASLGLQIGQSILCGEDDVCKQVGIGMPHGGLHWAKGGPIIRRRPGNLSPLKGAHLSPNRWSTACGRGYILSPLRGSLGCVKYVDAPLGEGRRRAESETLSLVVSRFAVTSTLTRRAKTRRPLPVGEAWASQPRLCVPPK